MKTEHSKKSDRTRRFFQGYWRAIRTFRISLFFVLVLFTGACGSEGDPAVPLSVGDFKFDGPHGSDGARIEKVGENHFKIELGDAPNQPGWPNKLNFEITDHARGNDLVLDVSFDGGPGMSFNEYFQSWSYDRQTWHPVLWERGHRDSPQEDRLVFGEFEQDRVFVGTQLPLSFEEAEKLLQAWDQHPDATLHTVGESLQGRPLYRLEITSSDSDIPRSDRWVHYMANQHPGEHNSQWRIAGVAEWLLSDDGQEARENSIVHLILYMSPDAAHHGWYRVNEEGVDMNRSFSPTGANQEEQAHEAYYWQRDLEEIMASESPVTTIWAMHTWQGLVEPLLRRGPEFGDHVGPWTELRDRLLEADPDSLIKPLALREGEPSYGNVSWSDGPNHQFGMTAILCEGGSHLYTKEENMSSGRAIIEALTSFYSGRR
ncbi:MAG: M14 family zinc carboxypeptidase [Balneolaceae bacterium]